MSERWRTSITDVRKNSLLVRGYPLEELIGQVTFPEVAYLVLRGELPDQTQLKMMNAILVAVIDHGLTTISAQVARGTSSSGVPLNTAVAAGILAMGEHHGGSIENAMTLFQTGVARSRVEEVPLKEMAERIVMDAKARKIRLPGFGHRYHDVDPRTIRLLSISDELSISNEHVGLARDIADSLERVMERKIPLNVDGTIASVLSDMGFTPAVGTGFFILGRASGLVAHVVEEKSRERPMRKMGPGPGEYDYDGPPPRTLKK